MDDFHDPLFKGCTRPAMLLGVPLVPLAAVSGIVVLLSIWFTLLFLLALIPIYAWMRMTTAQDDQQFRLLWQRFQFRVVNYDRNSRFWKASAYSPIAFRKR